MNRIIPIIIILCLLSFFFLFGRSIYMPMFHKVRGKQTVESISNTVEKNVRKRLEANFDQTGLVDYPEQILLVGLKDEQILEVYTMVNEEFKLLKRYPFTAMSGSLGQKLKEGDKQIPEGIYKIEYINPNSSYYLSLKVSYPNSFDKSKTKCADLTDMGNDIFIHGKSVTVGCIPIGDEAIEEVFLLASKAALKDIKVIISPRDFRVNPEYPKIESIEWESELYDLIREELDNINKR